MSVEMKELTEAELKFLKAMKRREEMFKYGIPLKVTVLKLLGYKQMPITSLSIDFVKVWADGTTKMERISVTRVMSSNIIQT